MLRRRRNVNTCTHAQKKRKRKRKKSLRRHYSCTHANKKKLKEKKMKKYCNGGGAKPIVPLRKKEKTKKHQKNKKTLARRKREAIISCARSKNTKKKNLGAQEARGYYQLHVRRARSVTLHLFRNTLGTHYEHVRNTLGTRSLVDVASLQEHIRNTLGTRQEHARCRCISCIKRDLFCVKRDLFSVKRDLLR